MKEALELFASLFRPQGTVPSGQGGPVPSAQGPVPTLSIPSLTGAADAFLAATLARSARVVLAVTPGLPEADRLVDDLRVLEKASGTSERGTGNGEQETRILELPPLIDNDKGALGLRLKTLAALKAWGLSPYPCVVVAAFPALSDPLPSGSVPSLVLGVRDEGWGMRDEGWGMRDGGWVALAIGPEGGWTDEEVALLESHGFSRYSLGPRILRTDTATVALLARLMPR